MSENALFAKLLSLYIWDNYHEIVKFNDILSLETPINDYHEDLVNKASIWLGKIQESLTIYDRALTPNGIYATTKEWLKQFGTFEQISEHKEVYTSHDPRRYKVGIIDHMGLIAGADFKKQKIDQTVDYYIYFRNKCDMTGIFVQQMNRNAKGMDRKLNGYEKFQLDDFKDTSGTTDGSEVVLALYFPFREKIARCEGYPIQNVLKKRFRLCQILKNRYGQADVDIGLSFYGEIGMFKDLPKPEEITDYEPYLNLLYRPTEVKEDVGEKEKSNNIFIL